MHIPYSTRREHMDISCSTHLARVDLSVLRIYKRARSRSEREHTSFTLMKGEMSEKKALCFY